MLEFILGLKSSSRSHPPAADSSQGSQQSGQRTQHDHGTSPPPPNPTEREPAALRRDNRPARRAPGDERRVRKSREELQLYGDYRTPADAVHIGVPGTIMSNKPGAQRAFVPKNTLRAPGFGTPRPKTSGHASGMSMGHGLEFQRSAGDNFLRRRGSFGFSDDQHTPKKRKIADTRTTRGHSSPADLVDLTDQDHVPPRAAGHQMAPRDPNDAKIFKPLVAPRSSHSGHSGRRGASRFFDNPEYHSVEAMMDPRRKSSQGSLIGLSQEGSRSPSSATDAMEHRDHKGGPHQPIDLCEDELARKDPVGRLMKVIDDVPNPKQSRRSKESRTSSDESTFRGKGAVAPFSKTGTINGNLGRQKPVRKMANIGKFSPGIAAQKQKRLESSDPVQMEESDDELNMVDSTDPKEPKHVQAVVREQGAKKSEYFSGSLKSEPRPKPERSDADFKPSTFVSKKAPKSAPKQPPFRSVKLDSSNGWPLKLIKIPGSNLPGPNLSLVPDPSQERYVVYNEDGPVPLKDGSLAVEPKKVTTIHCSDAEPFRIRVTGSKTGTEVYQRSMEFLDRDTYERFLSALRHDTKNTLKPILMPAERMERIFARQHEHPQSISESNAVDIGQEHALLEARGQRHHGRMEYGGGKERTNATRPRPLKLVSQMQSDLDRGEHSTRTSRTANASEKPRSNSSMALADMRSIRTINRIDRQEYSEESSSEVEKYSRNPGLGDKWTHPLMYPPTGRQRAQVDWEDLFKLDEGEYLNDSIIMFYIIWTANQFNLPRNKVYYFSTYFYSTLTTTGKGQRGINYGSVQRWTSKIDIFDHDYVVVPINEDAHWYLAIICNLPNVNRVLHKNEEDSSSLAAQTMAVLKPKEGGMPSEVTKEIDDSGDQMDIDDETDAYEANAKEERVSLDTTVERGDSREWESSTPKTTGARNSPIYLDEPEDEKGEGLTHPNGQSDAIKTSPSGKKGKKKAAPGLKRYDITQPTIIILDSLGLSHPRTTRNLKEYLIEEGKNKRSLGLTVSDLQGMTAKGIPHQKNFCDCGVFVCGYFQRFMRDPDEFVHKILQREMSAETDWPDMNPKQMRVQITELLLALAKQQANEHKTEKRKRLAGKQKTSSPSKEPSKEPERPPLSSPLAPGPEAFPEMPPTPPRQRGPVVLVPSPPKKRSESSERSAPRESVGQRRQRSVPRRSPVSRVRRQSVRRETSSGPDEMLFDHEDSDFEMPEPELGDWRDEARQNHEGYKEELIMAAGQGTGTERRREPVPDRPRRRDMSQPKEIIDLVDSQS